jgi:hypothetical protein
MLFALCRAWQDAQNQQMLLAEHRQQAKEAAVRLQARLSTTSKPSCSAPRRQSPRGQLQQRRRRRLEGSSSSKSSGSRSRNSHEASDQPTAASSNPFIAGHLTSELLWYHRREQQREQQRDRGEAAGHLPFTERVIEHGAAGPAGVGLFSPAAMGLTCGSAWHWAGLGCIAYGVCRRQMCLLAEFELP